MKLSKKVRFGTGFSSSGTGFSWHFIYIIMSLPVLYEVNEYAKCFKLAPPTHTHLPTSPEAFMDTLEDVESSRLNCIQKQSWK